jgi:large subunit ribosomal protein L6
MPSRVGKLPIQIPSGVQVQRDAQAIHVKGPKGEMRFQLAHGVDVAIEPNEMRVTQVGGGKQALALHGTTRAVLANMVTGVTKGFSKTLEIQGVGYKAEAKPYGVNLIVGYSHPVKYEAPKGIKISVENNTVVKVEGADKEAVGQVAAELRSVRPPEPYKGKGIRYQGEQVRRKAGKTGAK